MFNHAQCTRYIIINNNMYKLCNVPIVLLTITVYTIQTLETLEQA